MMRLVNFLLDDATYRAFKQLVGPRKMSPTIRKMIEDHIRAERIRRRVEGE